MIHSRLLGRSLAALLTFAALASFAFGAAWDAPKDGLSPIPPLTSAVTDQTGTLSPAERQALEAKLRDWEARTTNQLAVLIVPTTAPEAIEDYSIRVADAWKIGQKGKDNGAILLVAKNDKRMRIEVGYGFEGVLTDVTSRRIIAEDIAPEFSRGNFAAGINAGVDRIIAVVDGGEPLPAAATQRRSASPRRLRLRHDADRAPGRGADPGRRTPFDLRQARRFVGRRRASSAPIAWVVASSLLIAGAAAVIGFIVMLFMGIAGRGGPGVFIPGRRFGGGGFGGGGGFSGGGGGFGGGGASGGW